MTVTQAAIATLAIVGALAIMYFVSSAMGRRIKAVVAAQTEAPVKPDIAAINVFKGAVLLDTGEVIPITQLFDGAGDVCDEDQTDHATSGVAGPCTAGYWYAFPIAAFDRQMVA